MALAVCPLCDVPPTWTEPDAYRGNGSTNPPPLMLPTTPVVEIPPPPSFRDFRRE